VIRRQCIDGKAVAATVIETVKFATKALESEVGGRAGLTVVIVGDDPAG
jgi:methylenetetrahydrofolate dehydrogenase (NADP+)/methenyltetrahydrofolate cyclohydrolase